MSEQEELDNVSDEQISIPKALLDHERRISKVETEQGKIFDKLDDISANMEKQNNEQKGLLNKLIEHHLATKKLNISSFWKWAISITGAGGMLTIAITVVVNFFK